jgi:hypothetical protein
MKSYDICWKLSENIWKQCDNRWKQYVYIMVMCLNDIVMQALNRKELEDFIIDLYHNQNKTFREIQKIVRKSPRDIRAILNKVEPERASLSPSSRAYQMFNEGHNLIEVATLLNLR